MFQKIKLPLFVLLTSVTLVFVGCGDDSDTHDEHEHEHGAEGEGEGEHAGHEAGLTIEATLDGTTVGQNTLDITVTDKHGMAVNGAFVTVDPQMPMHGHGSSETPVVEELGDGAYRAFPVTFQMPGDWVITVEAHYDGPDGHMMASHRVTVTAE